MFLYIFTLVAYYIEKSTTVESVEASMYMCAIVLLGINV